MQIVVMAKEPRPGFAKTRLCPPCEPVEASRIAEAALADTLACVRATPARRHVIVLDGSPGEWLPDGFTVVPQVQGSFGARLEAALVAAFALGDEPVVLIGMDTPQVRPGDLVAIEAALRRGMATTAVLGLALDGGWWALGLNHLIPGLFDGVEMSVDTTGEQQMSRFAEVGYEVAQTASMRDMDHLYDAHAIAAMAPGSYFATTFAEVDAAIRRRGAVGTPGPWQHESEAQFERVMADSWRR
jgi:uncharacterized protein